MMKENITVVGIGYVGLGVGIMFSTEHDVIMLDVDQRRINLINEKKSPIKDALIEHYFEKRELSIRATNDKEEAYKDADIIFVAVPTNYDEEAGKFDTHLVENVVNEALAHNQNAMIIIKSTIPVGYTKGLRERLAEQGFKNAKVFFSPEFLREGTALKDNLFPSRVIVGCDKEDREQVSLAEHYLELMKTVTEGKYAELIMGSTEAEAVKLFANTYLAMRVAYFNELDTYAEYNGLNAKDIIEGVCRDPRIGDQYNNPSFGYGGYCLPKDAKQLLANFEEKETPQKLIGAIVESNNTRKMFIAMVARIKAVATSYEDPATVGIYRLSMKSGSDNFRQSAILDVIDFMKYFNLSVCIYEPEIKENEFNGCEVVKDLPEFKKKSNVIVTNRYSEELDDVKEKVYTRDIFNNN